MKRTVYLLATASLTLAWLPAQTPQQARGAYETPFAQSAQGLAGGRGGGAIAMPQPRPEKGRPFSATVTTQSTQTLADGTRVTQSTTMQQYRDAEGRVRTETTRQSLGSSEQVKFINIRDTVAGVTYMLDPAKKTAARLGMAGTAVGPAPVPAGGRFGSMSAVVSPPEGQPGQPQAASTPGAGGRGGGRGTGTGGGSGEGGGARGRGGAQPAAAAAELEALVRQVRARIDPNETTDDLGVQIVNGVAARGTRVTTVVPVGAIGNDREFRSVSERWFSDDLNLLIKSVSTDPRFGTTTYEMTNISRAAPDPSLFQPPADYTIVGAGGRGQQ